MKEGAVSFICTEAVKQEHSSKVCKLPDEIPLMLLRTWRTFCCYRMEDNSSEKQAGSMHVPLWQPNDSPCRPSESVSNREGRGATNRKGGKVKQEAGQKPAKGLMEAIRILKVALALVLIKIASLQPW